MRFAIPEKVLKLYLYKGAVVELVERPETLYAGKSVFADSPEDIRGDLGERLTESQREDFAQVAGAVQPELDVHISVNYWRIGKVTHGLVFGREVDTQAQPEGVDVYKMPASLFLRMFSDRAAAGLLGKKTCEPWELFAYFRRKIMPKYGYVMAENGAQAIEFYQPGSHGSGWAYVPVEQKRRRPHFEFAGLKRKSAPGDGAA